MGKIRAMPTRDRPYGRESVAFTTVVDTEHVCKISAQNLCVFPEGNQTVKDQIAIIAYNRCESFAPLFLWSRRSWKGRGWDWAISLFSEEWRGALDAYIYGSEEGFVVELVIPEEYRVEDNREQ